MADYPSLSWFKKRTAAYNAATGANLSPTQIRASLVRGETRYRYQYEQVLLKIGDYRRGAQRDPVTGRISVRQDRTRAGASLPQAVLTAATGIFATNWKRFSEANIRARVVYEAVLHGGLIAGDPAGKPTAYYQINGRWYIHSGYEPEPLPDGQEPPKGAKKLTLVEAEKALVNISAQIHKRVGRNPDFGYITE